MFFVVVLFLLLFLRQVNNNLLKRFIWRNKADFVSEVNISSISIFSTFAHYDLVSLFQFEKYYTNFEFGTQG